MRPTNWARWATCALALSIAVPAAAGKHKSLSDCTSFTQDDKGDDAVELTIKNSCTIPVECSVSWKVVCAPESAKRRAVHPGSQKLSLVEGGVQSAEASAAVCGDAGWSIEGIEWSCQPTKD